MLAFAVIDLVDEAYKPMPISDKYLVNIFNKVFTHILNYLYIFKFLKISATKKLRCKLLKAYPIYYFLFCLPFYLPNLLSYPMEIRLIDY